MLEFSLRLPVVCAVMLVSDVLTLSSAAEPTTILCLGDSITEGAAKFKVYRQPLDLMLQEAGYHVEFVGPKSSTEEGVVLHHAGYSGGSAAYLKNKFSEICKSYPADIILIHSVHNNSADQSPVEGVISELESIIHMARSENPKVAVLLAQGITSGKLPKYSYIPALNEEIFRLGKRLHSEQQPVVIVNQADGFNWETDTIEDMVHPNASGAEKMAIKWFDALVRMPQLEKDTPVSESQQ